MFPRPPKRIRGIMEITCLFLIKEPEKIFTSKTVSFIGTQKVNFFLKVKLYSVIICS